ncbi:MAG: DUF2079 domain-containing protein [Acidobacteriota bacterium]|nr:DUF2079 domain-containing protein [Acidobacteriota bacterium]
MKFADQTATPPLRLTAPADSERLRRAIRAAGWTLIGAQLIGLIWWSTYAAGRGSMSWDFAAYYQPWWAIAHGHLNPAATVMPGGYPFWRNDGEFIVWILAPLYWLFPNHQVGLWWIQDLALAGTSAVCYRWIGELLPWDTSKPASENVVPAVGWSLVALLLVLNPWIYWSTTFAIQMEPFGVLFAMLALRALMRGRRSVWVWCVLGALCGSASIVFVVSVGLVGLFTRGRQLRAKQRGEPGRLAWRASVIALRGPLAIVVGGAAWLVVLGALHATQSFSNPAISVHRDLAYLNGPNSRGSLLLVRTAVHALSHPGAVISVIASHALNLWANTAPAGFVGLLSGVGFFMSTPTLLENSILKGQDFSYPGFASLIVYVALALASALVIATVIRRHRRVGLALAALVVANAIAWCSVWLPKAGTQFVSIDAGAARALNRAAREIPPGAEVIASQGFVGRFAGRRDIRVFGGPSSRLQGPEVFPVHAGQVWFVLSAAQGIEVPSTSETDQAIGTVATLPHARLVSHGNGVWVFSWTPRGSVRSVALGGPQAAVPAWTTAGAAARARVDGSVTEWALTSTGASGYVVSGDIWRLGAGRYEAHVQMSSSVKVNIEVWDDANGTLLARRRITSRRLDTIAIPFRVGRSPQAPSSTGPAPFAYRPEPPPNTSMIEFRIWTPGNGNTEVRQLSVRAASHD